MLDWFLLKLYILGSGNSKVNSFDNLPSACLRQYLRINLARSFLVCGHQEIFKFAVHLNNNKGHQER